MTAGPADRAASFVAADLLERLGELTRADADAAPHGAINVDDDGVILLYNRYEADLAGFAPEDAEGSNFFTEIAPCTNNRLFYRRFRDGVAADALDVVFPYTFTYRMRPTLVLVHLRRQAGSNWIFVKKS